LGLAGALVQGSAHDQGSPGVALDQQHYLTVPKQRSKRSRHHRLRTATGHHDDDIGAVDSGSKIARHALDRGEPGFLPLDLEPAARSNVG
jgi:hypothetical protein